MASPRRLRQAVAAAAAALTLAACGGGGSGSDDAGSESFDQDEVTSALQDVGSLDTVRTSCGKGGEGTSGCLATVTLADDAPVEDVRAAAEQTSSLLDHQAGDSAEIRVRRWLPGQDEREPDLVISLGARSRLTGEPLAAALQLVHDRADLAQVTLDGRTTDLVFTEAPAAPEAVLDLADAFDVLGLSQFANLESSTITVFAPRGEVPRGQLVLQRAIVKKFGPMTSFLNPQGMSVVAPDGVDAAAVEAYAGSLPGVQEAGGVKVKTG